MIDATINARIFTKNDSNMNCKNNCFADAPITFLKPTSLDRSIDFAVDKLIKLIHAISKINAPINDNIKIAFPFP